MPRYADDDLFENTADTMDQDEVARAGPRVFTDGKPLPKLFIFDLDYTLWPFWIDTHVSPPMKPMAGNAAAKDRHGTKLSFYPDVPSILYSAHTLKVPMALASRTHTPDLAQKLLKLLHVPTPTIADPEDAESSTIAPVKAWDFFKYREIFPGDKKTHMRNISKASDIPFEDMVFFDDENRNSNVRSLGVHFHLVPDGVTNEEVDNAVYAWRKARAPSSDSR